MKIYKSVKRSSKKQQGGYALVAALLALVLTGITAAAKLNSDIIQQQRSLGLAEASTFKILERSGNLLIDGQLLNMLNGAPLVRNAVNIPIGMVGAVPTYTITPAQLSAMGYTPPGFVTANSTLNGGNYRITVSRLPVGCVFPNCTLEGLIWLDAPILNTTNTPGTYNGKIVGPLLTELGANSGVSMIGTSANITGFGNTWLQPNPVAGTPPGIVALRFDGIYMPDLIRTGDTRDPALLGNLTVAGNQSVGGTLTVAGATTLNNNLTINGTTTFGGPANLTGDTTIGGNLTVNGTNGITITGPAGVAIGVCAKIDGATGRAGLACRSFSDLPAGYTGGVRSADVVADQNILVSSSPGSFTGSNTNFAIMSAAGNAGLAEIRTSGRVAGDRLTPTGSYAPGSACTESGSISKNSAANGLVLCSSGTWKPFITEAAVNTVCSSNGQVGVNSNGAQLYCQQGTWVFLADRFGRFAVSDTYLVSHGTTISKPVCPAAGVPKIYFNPQGVDTRSYNATSQATNFRADEATSPGSYLIYVDDSVGPSAPLGNPTNGYGLAVVGCFYN